MPAGQPAIKLSDLPKDWEKKMLDLGKKGKGPVHMARALGVARSTFYLLKEREPRFSDALEEAMQEAQIWWENAGQEGMFMGGKDNPFQASLWSFNMANRFGWTSKNESKTDITTKGESINKIERVIVNPQD